MLKEFGVPYGNRTRVAAVKGRCPRPLDERDAWLGVRALRQARYVTVVNCRVSNGPLQQEQRGRLTRNNTNIELQLHEYCYASNSSRIIIRPPFPTLLSTGEYP